MEAETPAELAVVAEVVTAALSEQRAAEQGWTGLTDNDRLDRAFAALEARGILARQDFSDCGTCGAGEILGLAEASRADGRAMRGYAFFHQQDTDALLDGSTGLYLSYGADLPADTDEAAYETAATAIGHEVAEAVRAEGLAIDWDGDLGQRIGVRIDWRRRRFTEAPPP